MSVKKLLILSAASLFAVTCGVFAGGPDDMGPPPAQEASMFDLGMYADVHGGYIFQDWNQLMTVMDTIWANQAGMSSNSKGGFVGGVDLGLRVTENIAAEMGGFYLPKVTGTGNGNNNFNAAGCSAADGVACTKATQYNWLLYAAGKFSLEMPYLDGFDVFAKVGAGYRAMSNKNIALVGKAGPRGFWTVIYGAGLEYEIMQSGFKVGAQWLHIPDNTSGDDSNPTIDGKDGAPGNAKKQSRRQPAANMITGSIGYTFDF